MDFSTTIGFAESGEMPLQIVSGTLAFEPDTALAVTGTTVSVDLIADGAHAPIFTGFRPWDGSSGYANVFDVRNCVTFFYRGGMAWYAIGHDATLPVEGLQPAPPAPPPPPPPAPAPPAPPAGTTTPRIVSLMNATESGDAVSGWGYTSTQPGFVNGGVLDKHLAAGVDGVLQFTVGHACAVPHNTVVGFQASGSWNTSVASMQYGIWIHQDGHVYSAHSGSYVSTGIDCQLGDVIRATRTGSTITWERLRSGTWTTLKAYDAVASLLYVWLNLSDSGSTALSLQAIGLS